MCALLLDCLRAREPKFSACELASIATSAARRARRTAKSMNGALLLRPRGRRRPKDPPGSRCGVGTSWVAPSVDVKGRLRHDNGVALVCLTLLQMVSRPPPLFSFASPAFELLPVFSFSFYLLSVCFSLLSLGKEVAALQRWVYCGGRFFFFNLCYCQSWPFTLDTHAHTDI